MSGVIYHPFGGVKGYTLGNGQVYARGIAACSGLSCTWVCFPWIFTTIGGGLLKTAKIATIALAAGLSGLIAAPAYAQDTAVMQRDIKWQDAPSIGPGAKTAVIDGDPKSSGPFVMRLKLPPKTTIGVHTHPTTESVTVLSGTLYFAAGDKLNRKSSQGIRTGHLFFNRAGQADVCLHHGQGNGTSTSRYWTLGHHILGRERRRKEKVGHTFAIAAAGPASAGLFIYFVMRMITRVKDAGLVVTSPVTGR